MWFGCSKGYTFFSENLQECQSYFKLNILSNIQRSRICVLRCIVVNLYFPGSIYDLMWSLIRVLSRIRPYFMLPSYLWLVPLSSLHNRC